MFVSGWIFDAGNLLVISCFSDIVNDKMMGKSAVCGDQKFCSAREDPPRAARNWASQTAVCDEKEGYF